MSSVISFRISPFFACQPVRLLAHYRAMNKSVSKYMRKIGSKGGNARMQNLSSEELTEIGKKGAEAMWKKRRDAKRRGK